MNSVRFGLPFRLFHPPPVVVEREIKGVPDRQQDSGKNGVVGQVES